MMRVVIALLLAALSVSSAHAQGVRFPVRFHPNPATPPPSQESVTITTPSGSTVTTTASTMVLQGSVTQGLITEPVTWSSDQGPSGTADLNGDTRVFTVAVPGSAIQFSDDVTRTTNANVIDHTPEVGSWAALITDGGNFCRAMSLDYIQPNVGDAGGTAIVACEMIPATSISGDNYDIRITLGAGAWSIGSTGNTVLIFDIVDVTGGTKDYCTLELLSSTLNPDVRLTKTVNDVSSILSSGAATANVAPLNGQRWWVKVRGNDIEAYQDGVLRISATDADCNRAMSKRAALAYGATYVGGTRIVATGARVNFLTFEDPDAGSTGIPLSLGSNVITVEACEVGGSPCHTATVTVIRAVDDTTGPNISTTVPSAGDFSTDQTTNHFEGLVDDVSGVASVVAACATCTPTSLTATLVAGTWITGDFTTPADATHAFTITATDASGDANETVISRNITVSAAADTTDPTISILLPEDDGASNTTVTTVTLSGEANDNVALRALNPITWTSNGCGSGNAAGSLSWSINPIALAASCTVTVTATDTAGRTATDTHTFTLLQPLTISTTTMPVAIEDSAYSSVVLATGGTAPYTAFDNNSGGSSLGGGACAGLSITLSDGQGLVSGTPTNTGTCNFTVKVTDTAAGTDTQALSIAVGTGTLKGQDHSYSNALCARADLMPGKCYNLRSDTALAAVFGTNGGTLAELQAAVCPNNSGRVWQYDPANDPSAERFDGAKMRICTWSVSAGAVLAAPMASATPGDYTLITVTTTTNVAYGRVFLVENEMVVASTATPGANPKVSATQFWAKRGMYSTTAAAHSSGIPIYPNATKLTHQLYLPFSSSTTASERYLITWDWYPDATWAGMGAPGDCTGVPGGANDSHECSVSSNGFKGWQIRAPSVYHEIKPNANISSGDAPPGLDDDVTHVGGVLVRNYNAIDGRPGVTYTRGNPTRPVTNKTYIIKPSEVMRHWLYVERNHDSNSAAFRQISTITADIPSGSVGDIVNVSISYTGLTTEHNVLGQGAGCSTTCPPTGTYDYLYGRRFKIGSEIFSLYLCPTSGNPRVCTMKRGADGSTPAAHSSGAAISTLWDYFTLIVASGTQAPVTVYDRLPMAPNRLERTGSGFGPVSMNDFNVEFDDSATQIQKNRLNNFPNDMTSYIPHVVMLRKDGSASDSSGGSALPAEWLELITAPSVDGN